MLRSTDFNTFTAFLERVITTHDYVDLFKIAAESTQEGLVLEFGVAEAYTLNKFNDCYKGQRTLHGFDWFQGLPEDWRHNYPAGSFKCNIPEVPDNIKLHIGLFQDTLEKFLEQEQDSIALIHMDADLYSSTDYVMRRVESRFKPGTLLYFDELVYPAHNFKEHEYKAFIEHHERTGFHYEFLGRRNDEAYGFRLI